MVIQRIITNRLEALSDSTVCVQYHSHPRDYSHMLQRNTVRYDVGLGTVPYRTARYGTGYHCLEILIQNVRNVPHRTVPPSGSVRIWTIRYQYCTVPYHFFVGGKLSRNVLMSRVCIKFFLE